MASGFVKVELSTCRHGRPKVTCRLLYKSVLISDFIFVFTAAIVVPCGGRKTSPRTSTIVQFILYFSPLRSAMIF